MVSTLLPALPASLQPTLRSPLEHWGLFSAPPNRDAFLVPVAIPLLPQTGQKAKGALEEVCVGA